MSPGIVIFSLPHLYSVYRSINLLTNKIIYNYFIILYEDYIHINTIHIP